MFGSLGSTAKGFPGYLTSPSDAAAVKWKSPLAPGSSMILRIMLLPFPLPCPSWGWKWGFSDWWVDIPFSEPPLYEAQIEHMELFNFILVTT